MCPCRYVLLRALFYGIQKKLLVKNMFTVLIQKEMFYWLLYISVFLGGLSGQICKLGAMVYIDYTGNVLVTVILGHRGEAWKTYLTSIYLQTVFIISDIVLPWIQNIKKTHKTGIYSFLWPKYLSGNQNVPLHRQKYTSFWQDMMQFQSSVGHQISFITACCDQSQIKTVVKTCHQ